MSKTIRNPDANQRAGREDAPSKEKVPTPYPPIEPTVANKKSEQKDR